MPRSLSPESHVSESWDPVNAGKAIFGISSSSCCGARHVMFVAHILKQQFHHFLRSRRHYFLSHLLRVDRESRLDPWTTHNSVRYKKLKNLSRDVPNESREWDTVNLRAEYSLKIYHQRLAESGKLSTMASSRRGWYETRQAARRASYRNARCCRDVLLVDSCCDEKE